MNFMMDVNGSLYDPGSSRPHPAAPSSALVPSDAAGGFSASVHSVSVPGGPAPDLNLQPLSPRKGPAHALRRGWWLVLVGMAAGLGTAYAYCKRTVPLYSDTARIFLADSGPHVTDSGPSTPGPGFLPAQMELIQSIPLMDRVATATDARQMRTFRGATDVPAALRDAVAVEPDPRADTIFNLSINTPYPEEGARVLGGVIKAYADQVGTSQQTSINGVVDVLQRQVADAKRDEAAALDEVKRFRLQNPTMNVSTSGPGELDRQAAGVKDQQDELQRRLATDRAACDAAEAALAGPDTVRRYADSIKPDVTAVPDDYATTAGDLGRAQRALAQLTAQGSGPGNPQWRYFQSSVASLEAHLPAAARARVDAHLQDARAQLRDGDKQGAELARTAADLRSQLDDSNAKATDFAALQGQLATRQADRAKLEQQIRGLKLQEQAGGITVSVLEPPRPAAKPVWPLWNRSLAVGGFAGGVLGVAGAILLAGVDSRIRTGDEAVEELGLPVLGVIPRIRGGGKRAVPTAGAARARVVQFQPADDVAEAYRTIRTALYFGTAGGGHGAVPRRAEGGPRRVLVTSPLPGDGKSTFASNLAIVMAQSGRRVVLVDADLRRPTQQANHEMKDAPGTLADVFAGRVQLAKLVRRTSIDRLHLLACGPAAGAAELLTSPLFAKMLDSLNRVSDVVIIDSPPVLPVADARILAVGCDATILVLRCGRSTRKSARQARDNLLSVGASLIGAVVNDVPRAPAKYGYGGAYGSVVNGHAMVHAHGLSVEAGDLEAAMTPPPEAAGVNGTRHPGAPATVG